MDTLSVDTDLSKFERVGSMVRNGLLSCRETPGPLFLLPRHCHHENFTAIFVDFEHLVSGDSFEELLRSVGPGDLEFVDLFVLSNPEVGNPGKLGRISISGRDDPQLPVLSGADANDRSDSIPVIFPSTQADLQPVAPRDLVHIVVSPGFIVGDDQVHIAVPVEVRLGHSTSVAQAVETIRGRPFDKLTIAKVDQKAVSFVSVERPVSDECIAVEVSFCEGLVRRDRTGVECRSQVVGIFPRDPSICRIDIEIPIVIDI